MKRLIVSLLVMVASVSLAADKPDGPVIRLSVQLIEMPQGAVTRILDDFGGDDAKLWKATSAAVREGTAKVVDATSVTTLPEVRATVTSAAERIYPVDQETACPPGGMPPGFPRNPALRPEIWSEWFDLIGRPYLPGNWDTQLVGMVFEGQCSFDAKQGTVGVGLPEWVGELEPVVWKKHVDEWGDASVRRPVFTKVTSDVCLTLLPGRFVLVAVLTPQPEPPPPALSKRVMVFARADLLRQ